MRRDGDGAVAENVMLRIGGTPVRAKMFARVGGMIVRAGAARPARASLTAWYEGTVALLGTPGAAAVGAALAEDDGGILGTITLALGEPGTAGVYAVEGRVRGRRLELRGGNGLGAHLCWRGRLARQGVVRGRVRIQLGDAWFVGTLALAPRTMPGACGGERFAGVVMPVAAGA